jgi:hypothetical protein
MRTKATSSSRASNASRCAPVAATTVSTPTLGNRSWKVRSASGQLEHAGGRVADPEPAVDREAGLLGGAGGGVGGLDGLVGLGQQGPAGLGHLHAPAADEQLHAQLTLERLDLAAERWLGDAAARPPCRSAAPRRRR